MTALLLDTNVASELRKARHPATDPNFASWAESFGLQSAYLSVITCHEIMRGVMLAERRDPSVGAVYRSWLDDLHDAFHGRILDLTREAAEISAAFHVPDPAPLVDALIAGTAVTHGLAVATRNVGDFLRFGVEVVNPWEAIPGEA